MSGSLSIQHIVKPINSMQGITMSPFIRFLLLVSLISSGPLVFAQQLTIEEIIVTASKREISIQDDPTSITALGSEDIDRRSIVGMQDYLSTVPGVTMTDQGAGQNKITMRGIAAGTTEESTVGVYFGEVPLTGYSTGFAVDMKLVDMERIEVIRGPQGTLFGSGSMSGVVRNIPKAPNTAEFEAWVGSGLSYTDGGSENFKFEGAINIPLVKDTLAIRLVGYEIDNSGYIQNVGAEDPRRAAQVNRFGGTFQANDEDGADNTTGIRASVLWTPTDKFELNFSIVNQDIDQDGFTEVNPMLNGYKSAPLITAVPISPGVGLEGKTDNTKFYSLVGVYDFGWGSLTASGSHLEGDSDYTLDIGRNLPWPIAVDWDEAKEGDVVEIRMNTQFESPFHLLAGFYYEDLQRTSARFSPWIGDLDLFPSANLGNDPLDIFITDERWFVEQVAFFGEASYTFFDKLTFTAGARHYDYDRHEISNRTGAFNGSGVFLDEKTSESDTLYKFNASYAFDENMLFYATYSEGFRLGQPTTPPVAVACDTDNDGLFDGTPFPINPGPLDSDTLKNLELGAKLSLLDSRLVVNAAVYHIDWQGIPVTITSPTECGNFLEVNAGKARSRGAELELTYYLSDGLLARFGTAYVDAELTEDAESLGEKGTQLPGAPEFTANFGLQYDFNVAGHEAFARGDYFHIGEYYSFIREQFAQAGDYGRLDMRGGIRFDNNFSVELFGTNLTNEDALMGVSGPVIGWRVRPRTVGVEIKYEHW